MKTMLIISTLNSGGAERVMSSLANEFSIKNNEVHLVLLVKSVHFFKVNNKVIIHELGFENKNFYYRIYSQIKTFIRLRALFKKERPDIVLSFLTQYNVFTILASRFLKLKVFVSDRSNPKKKLPKTIDFLRNTTYKYATGIIAQTSLAKEILEKSTGSKNIKVIPNPIKINNFHYNHNKENIILNVGRLIPQKGQKYLIEAFSKLTNTDWKLVILGEGDLRDELENQIKNLGITNRVYMPGSVQNVDEWMEKASIFAFPSISEGFPNALVEAMSLGLPCVSFDCDAGPRDIIENKKNGIIIPIKDVDLLKKAINNLIEDINLRIQIGSEARTVSDKYTIEKIGQQYLNFCKND